MLPQGRADLDPTNSMNGDWLPPQQGSQFYDQIKVRCPQCFQSFRINAKEVHQARPKFACTKCHSKFWLPFPESLKQKELIGFPLSWIESAPETKATVEGSNGAADSSAVKDDTFECPSCGFANAKDQAECKKCGVVFEKIMARVKDEEEGVTSTPNLRKMWKQILTDFENDELHEEFLLECQKLNCLTFATRRYSQLGEAVGVDDTIEKMMERLNSLSQQKLAHLQAPLEAKAKSSNWRPGWLSLSNIMLFFAFAVIAVGMMTPGGRNLIGAGAALGFLSLAVRFTFR